MITLSVSLKTSCMVSRIHAPLGDLRVLLIGLKNLEEALGLAFGFVLEPLAVALGLLDHALRLAAGARQHVVAVGVGFVAQALPVLARALDVVEGVDDRPRGLDVLKLDLGDLDAGLVFVEDILE